MNPNRIEELAAKATQGELTSEEAGELLAACRADPRLRRRLALLCGVDRLIALSLKEHADRFSEQVEQRLACEEPAAAEVFTERVAARLRRERLVRWCAGLGGIAALLAAAFLLAPGNPVPVATLTRSVGTRLDLSADGLVPGRHLVVETGLVEVSYEAGVRVVVEGPADYEITGAKGGYLHRGRLVAEVFDSRGQGFTVDGPSGRLVDLGTKFGVSVAANGGMEVHVLKGVVKAEGKDGKTTRLVENQALRISGDGLNSALPQADAEAFVTALPPVSDSEPRSVRWTFDEISNGSVPDSGRELGGGIATAEFRSFAGLAREPERVPGPYGSAVRFDGRDSWFESRFKGIAGPTPRTVAFWMRVPKDVTTQEGYGIVSWGDVSGGGTAWQISVNPIREEGPIGRLRVGTGRGWVVGTTDLRDDRWHHYAVVLYGDPAGKPNTSTHILLYVDGVMEPAARKAVRDIDTRITGATGTLDHGIWMGRNLAFHDPKVPGYDGKFFRGDLDEMVICDTALSQDQIKSLMSHNTTP